MSDLLRELTDTLTAADAPGDSGRQACTDALNRMAANMEAASAVWRGCLDRTDPVENRFTVVTGVNTPGVNASSSTAALLSGTVPAAPRRLRLLRPSRLVRESLRLPV